MNKRNKAAEVSKTPAYHALQLFVADDIVRLIKQAYSLDMSCDAVSDVMERPKAPEFGDFALPCFFLAKLLRSSPQDIASTFAVMNTEECEWIGELDAVSGFLNITLDTPRLARYVFSTLFASKKNVTRNFVTEKHLQAPHKNIVVEYSQPNTHKTFHVGHSRNVCLGQSLCRLYKYTLSTVVEVNYIGDEGTHVAKCLGELAELEGKIPQNTSASEFYNKLYTIANEKAEVAKASSITQALDSYRAKISAILSELENKHGPYYELWLESKELCMKDFMDIYKWLQVKFDHIYYESELTSECQDILEEYTQKGLFAVSDGALGLDLKDRGLGFMMVRKTDGNTLYITKDIALAFRKKRDYPDTDKFLYVVGNEQNFHFQQLFACLQLMDAHHHHHHVEQNLFEHISYGMVVLPEGKMSSRKGNTVGFWELEGLLREKLRNHLKKYEEQWTDTQLLETLYKLTSGTLKWGMLAQDPQKELVFDASSWSKFEGQTGPYVMYAYARAQSILNKSHKDVVWSRDHKFAEFSYNERKLLFEITRLGAVCYQARDLHKPSLLCNYLLDLAREFSRFYKNCPIFTCTDKETRIARLWLVQAFSVTILQGLDVLGITPPQSM